jgi:hypothetical protein
MMRSPSILFAVASIAAVSAVLVSSAAAAPTVPVITITTDSSCSQASTCTDYDISIKNPGTLPINGVTISIVPLAPITGFMLAGQPPSQQTGVQDAWAISPSNIPGGATDKGTFQVVTPLTATDSISVYTTEDGFLSSVGLDEHVQAPTKPPAGKPGLTEAWRQLDFALQHEKAALKVKTGAEMVLYTEAGRSALRLARLGLIDAAKSGEIDTDLESTIKSDIEAAMSDDLQAEKAEKKDDVSSGERWLTKARAKKEAALRLVELALWH